MDMNKQPGYGYPGMYDGSGPSNRMPPNMQQNPTRYGPGGPYPPHPGGPGAAAGMNFGNPGAGDGNYPSPGMHDNNLNRMSYQGRLAGSVEPSMVAFDSSDFPALNRNMNAPYDNYGAQNVNQRPRTDFAIHNEDFPALGGVGSSGENRRTLNAPSGYYGQAPQHSQSQQPQMNMMNLGQQGPPPQMHGTPSPIGDGRTPPPDSSKTYNQAFAGVQSPSKGPVDVNSLNMSDPQKRTGFHGEDQTPGSGTKVQGAGKKTSLTPDQQFGLLGLLGLIRMDDPDPATLALGIDLTSLGLNLNSSELLHTHFVSPWTDRNTQSREPQFQLPSCYAIKSTKGGLNPNQLSRLLLESLFYIFYSFPRDTLQMLAAQELYTRNWRFHSEHKVWVTQEAQNLPTGQSVQYVMFDIQNWERRPFSNANLPPNFTQGFLSSNVILGATKTPSQFTSQ